jgi:hypothetical protein
MNFEQWKAAAAAELEDEYGIDAGSNPGGDLAPVLCYKPRAAQRRRAGCRALYGRSAPLARQRPAIGKIKLTSFDDLKTTVRRNKLLGMWAAEKLGLVGRDAEAYADALAVGTIDPDRADVFSKLRKDFDAVGVVQSDEQILRVMNELMLQAANQMQATRGGAPDAAAAMLARNLTSR